MYKYFNSTCGKIKGLILQKVTINNLSTKIQTGEHLEKGCFPYLSTLSTIIKYTCAKSYPHIHKLSVDKIKNEKKLFNLRYFILIINKVLLLFEQQHKHLC